MRDGPFIEFSIYILVFVIEATLQDPKMGLILALVIIGAVLTYYAACYLVQEISDFFERNTNRFL